MKQPRYNILILLFMLELFFIVPRVAMAKMHVFVSIIPQKYFVDRIAGGLVDVSVMVRPGANPGTYEPRPRQMAALAKAGIYFSIGVPFEKAWLKKIRETNQKMIIVATDKGIDKLPMEYNIIDHKDQTVKGIPDPHIWLSPPLVKIQAKNILNGLIQADKKNKLSYRAGYKKFMIRIDKFDRVLKSIFNKKSESSFMVFHPAWGYFAKAYGLRQIAVELRGRSPKPARLQELIQFARKNKIKTIMVQPQFSKKSPEIIARAIGGSVVAADPLAVDWEKNLLKQARAIASGLR